MAAAVEHTQEPVECGYCLGQDEQLNDPRSLPCHHIYCYPCLLGDFEANKIVRCGRCSAVYDIELARLPRVGEGLLHAQLCDVCEDQGPSEQQASLYCIDCTRKLCIKHSEVHTVFYSKHKNIIDIETYRQDIQRLEIRYCGTHKDKAIIAGCSVCHLVFCIFCMDGDMDCHGSSVHTPVYLEHLIKVLKSRRNALKAEAHEKENVLVRILKYSSKILSEYEIHSNEMFEKLELGKDVEGQNREKFDEMGEKVTEVRKTTRFKIMEFMESVIGGRLTHANTMLLLQDERFKTEHEVDIVTRYNEAANEIRRFVDEDLPALHVPNQIKLFAPEKPGDLSLVSVSDYPVKINERTSRDEVPRPTGLKLLKDAKSGEYSWSVLSHHGSVYIGGRNRSLKMNEVDFSVDTYIPFKGFTCNCIEVHNDNFYMLTYPNEEKGLFKVNVFDPAGTLIRTWTHSDTSNEYNQLVILNNMVVIPDKSHHQLCVYTLVGEPIKTIPYPPRHDVLLMSLCAVDDDSVVVVSTRGPMVFRANIEMGKVIWCTDKIPKPGGVVAYGNEYLLVSPSYASNTIIHVVDAKTGEMLSTLTEPSQKLSTNIFDLEVFGNTLIVPRRDEYRLLFYELTSEPESSEEQTSEEQTSQVEK